MAEEVTTAIKRASRLGAVHLLLASFAVAIGIGTILLWLPVSTHGQPLSLVDALFTATSAVCVTGLIVVDTGAKFTDFGHAVIICLIQAGGLGIMTFSTLILVALGQRAGIRQGAIIRDGFAIEGPVNPARLVVWIVAVTAVIEAIGAALLLVPMLSVHSTGMAVKSAAFHSISAFCNAGFSLYSDSLTRFRHMGLANGTVTVLIVIGGLGFPVVAHLKEVARKRLKGTSARVNLHARLVLITSAALLAAGMVIVFFYEYSNEMSRLGLGERLWAAWFQSVTARTAGFNTINFAKATDGTLFVSSLLMFVGGSPGGTAGGVKTTTFAVLVILVLSMFRERRRAEVMGRQLPRRVIRGAVVVVALEATLIIAAVVILLGTQAQIRWPHGKGAFSCILFEVFSAFGTVGLSTGITGQLNSVGKAAIIMAMFIGRLGPLAIVQSIAGSEKYAEYEYPEETVMVG